MLKRMIIVVTLLTIQKAKANSEIDAARQLAKYFYKKTGLKNEVKDLEKEYITDDIKHYVLPPVYLANVLVKKELRFKIRSINIINDFDNKEIRVNYEYNF